MGTSEVEVFGLAGAVACTQNKKYQYNHYSIIIPLRPETTKITKNAKSSSDKLLVIACFY
jgi:hypothetical protein